MQDRKKETSAPYRLAALQHIFDREDAGHIVIVHPDTPVHFIRDSETSGIRFLVRLFSPQNMKFCRKGTDRTPERQQKDNGKHGAGKMHNSPAPRRDHAYSRHYMECHQ
jgi:hypothetical protein